MSGEALRETLGFIGVVASLVFVGIEIRQNTIVARAAAYQDIGFVLRKHIVPWRSTAVGLNSTSWQTIPPDGMRSTLRVGSS